MWMEVCICERECDDTFCVIHEFVSNVCGWISHHLLPTTMPKRNRISLGLSGIWDSCNLSPPVQLIEGRFCWQLLCVTHPGSLWTPHFLPSVKEINEQMGVIVVLKEKWWIRAFCSPLCTGSVFLPATGKHHGLLGTVLLISIRSTYFPCYISAGRTVVWADIRHTRYIAHHATSWGHPGLEVGRGQLGCTYLSWECTSCGVNYSAQRVDMTNDLWLGAGVCLMRDTGATLIHLALSILTLLPLVLLPPLLPQDLTQVWVDIGLIELHLETENLAPVDTLGFIPSEEVLNYDLLCDSVVYLPDSVL